jgi:Ca2+-transporting ATPase
MAKLAELGGAAGLADILHSSTHQGLESTANGAGSVEEHRRVFGPNTFPPAPQKNFFVLCFENIQDPIILLLMAAALVSLCLQMAPRGGCSQAAAAAAAAVLYWQA